jgi:cobyrinic acid a,c-diamide synthase
MVPGLIPGLILAAPSSGSGKTTLTLALLRRLRNAGRRVAAAKVGPDYIDPQFHAAACGRPSLNLDPWAMRPGTLAEALETVSAEAELLLIEGVMGLFDGGPGGVGATADLAAALDLPVVLVVDVRKQAQSVAALLRGFRDYRDDVEIAGVIFNQVGSPRHAALLGEAVAPEGLAVLGNLPRRAGLSLPERHLGLVQAGEQAALEPLLERAAEELAGAVDLAALEALMRRPRCAAPAAAPLPPRGQRIAVARDIAFAFAYPHLLDGWRRAGAELSFFSPLADEAPAVDCDAVYLPGGYPELHAGRLAGNRLFLDGLRAAAQRGAVVFGECGGYMVLGEELVDAEGRGHAMAGLLPLATSFAERRLHLGYRAVTTLAEGPLGPAGLRLRGHEFHYATVLREDGAVPVFAVSDAADNDLGAAGLSRGKVQGSFIHMIDRAD